MQEFLSIIEEQIPEEFKKIKLNSEYIFITTSRAQVFYYDAPLASLIEPKNSQKIYFRNFENKIITIVDNNSIPNSIFSGEQFSTGSIEKDIIQLFQNYIMVRGGNPAGFLRRPNPRYEENHKFKGQLRGRIYNNGKLQEEISLDDYINHLKTL